MEVILAGHNIDYEIIREIAAEHPERQDLTPETVAAAYARISRNPRPVNELQDARPGRGGKGARLQPEHRLRDGPQLHRRARRLQSRRPRRSPASSSKRSKSSGSPPIPKNPSATSCFRTISSSPPRSARPVWRRSSPQPSGRRTAATTSFTRRLRPFVFDRHPELAADPANSSLLEGWAKEDARYIIPLATETQLGMTVNARNLELMIRRLAASPLAEAQEYSRRLYDATQAGRPVARPLHGTHGLRPGDARGASGAGGRDHRKNAGHSPGETLKTDKAWQAGGRRRRECGSLRPPARRDAGGRRKGRRGAPPQRLAPPARRLPGDRRADGPGRERGADQDGAPADEGLRRRPAGVRAGRISPSSSRSARPASPR